MIKILLEKNYYLRTREKKKKGMLCVDEYVLDSSTVLQNMAP